MASRDSILVSRTLYQIGYVTVIASIIWVGVGIYSATNKEFKVDVEQSLLEPINPVLDQATIKALAERIKVEDTLATGSATIDVGGVR